METAREQMLMAQRRALIAGLHRMEAQIVAHLGCSNCGAKAGQLCHHDYGCVTADRTVTNPDDLPA